MKTSKLTKPSPCKGKIEYTIDKENTLVALKFLNPTPSEEICADCPYVILCSQLSLPKTAQKPPQLSVGTIQVYAFTGMSLGELPIIKETKNHIEVQTKKGDILKFDKVTGKQLNAKNPRFGNTLTPKGGDKVVGQ